MKQQPVEHWEHYFHMIRVYIDDLPYLQNSLKNSSTYLAI